MEIKDLARDFGQLEKLMELMRRHGMGEVRLSDGTARVVVVAAQGHPMQPALAPAYAPPTWTSTVPVIAPGPTVAPPAGSPEKNAAQQHASKGRVIKSPFVGTFYRSPTPGADAFVSVGQRVRKGDTLCIVEAMKLMNEIEAESDGVIKEILVENETPVEFEQPLFIIE
jgi:acetyl-CoA carboxylase biotin carboxyl carrier protein